MTRGLTVHRVQFRVQTPAHGPCAVLHRQDWNDRGHAATYQLTLVNDAGERTEIGWTKVLGRNDGPPPVLWSGADPNVRSVGQSLDFYRRMNDHPLGPDALLALGDMVSRGDDPHADPQAAVLLRFSAARFAAEHAARVLRGQEVPPSPLRLRYRAHLSSGGFTNAHDVSWDFDGASPLGRLGVLAGRNGVGKTALLGQLAFALCGLQEEEGGLTVTPDGGLGRVLALSYSAFDSFSRPIRLPEDVYRYCGLRGPHASLDRKLARERWPERRAELVARGRLRRWLDAVAFLVPATAEPRLDPITLQTAGVELLGRISSGHEIALLMVTELMAGLESRSVVLLDEPEVHLHPALLTRFLRTVHALLEEYDAFGIVATHSPMPLQEVPARHVRVLKRSGPTVRVVTPSRETFGESLDELLHVIFGISREDPNYVARLEEAVANDGADAVRATLQSNRSFAVNLALDEHAQ